MKVEVEDLSAVKKILHIEVPADKVSGEIDQAYRTLKRTAKIKGFRPGKAPRAILENLYRKSVNAEVSAKLMEESFPEALKETELRVVGEPDLDSPELDATGPYKYDVTVEVRPEIDEVDFKGLELKKTRYEVTDEDVDTQIQGIQRSQVRFDPLEEERSLQKGDVALIDYELFKGGEPLPDSQKTEGALLKVGDGAISQEFDEQVVGMNPGENREIEVDFPEDHANKQIAGQKITFQVTLNEIQTEILPEINDVLAKKAGDFENLDDLRENIADNLKKGHEGRVDAELNAQIVEGLLKRSDFDVPDAMVQAQIDSMIAGLVGSYGYQKLSPEDLGQSRDALADRYRKPAEERVKRLILMNRIIEQEELVLSDEELDAEYGDMSEQMNQPVEEIRTFYRQDEDRLDSLKYSLLEKRAFGLIIENSDIEEVEPETGSDPEEEAS